MVSTRSPPSPHVLGCCADTSRLAANRTIYGLEFMPETLPTDKLTHVLYAFGDIAPDGTV